MYNEAKIQFAKSEAAEYKRLTTLWHGRAQTMFVLMLVAVVLDLLMIALPFEWGGMFLAGIIIALLYLVSHIVCVIMTKRYHAKRLEFEAYIEKNDYKNINNPPAKPNNEENF